MDRTLTRRVIAAGAIGNMLEWYDFAIYGYFAAVIGRTFFPNEDPVAQLLAASHLLDRLRRAPDRRRAAGTYRRPLRATRGIDHFPSRRWPFRHS
jgi:hypothetical protein